MKLSNLIAKLNNVKTSLNADTYFDLENYFSGELSGYEDLSYDELILPDKFLDIKNDIDIPDSLTYEKYLIALLIYSNFTMVELEGYAVQDVKFEIKIKDSMMNLTVVFYRNNFHLNKTVFLNNQ